MAWFIPMAASMLTSKIGGGGGQQNTTPAVPHSQPQNPQMNSPMNWLQPQGQGQGQVDPMKHLMNLLTGYQPPQ
jgi:hypothetical protein